MDLNRLRTIIKEVEELFNAKALAVLSFGLATVSLSIIFNYPAINFLVPVLAYGTIISGKNKVTGVLLTYISEEEAREEKKNR